MGGACFQSLYERSKSVVNGPSPKLSSSRKENNEAFVSQTLLQGVPFRFEYSAAQPRSALTMRTPRTGSYYHNATKRLSLDH